MTVGVRGRDLAVHSAFRIPHSAFDLMPDDLADVYRTTYRALVRFLYRKVWSAERAEDLAQEAFARALVHKPENARGGLFVVAANMARDDEQPPPGVLRPVHESPCESGRAHV